MNLDQLFTTGALAPFAVVIFALAVAWSILLFLLPFFVYGAWYRAKQCSEKLDTLISLQHRALEKPAPPPSTATHPPN